MSNGDSGGGFDFGSLFTALVSGLVGFIEAIILFLNQLVAVIATALNYLYDANLTTFNLFSDLSHVLLRILKKLAQVVWQAVIQKALIHLYELYQKLRDFVKKLKGWLDRFHRLQQLNQVQAFRRVINLIQRIRKILVLFRVLHLKFATKLDNWLGNIQGILIRKQVLFSRKTNEIIAWLNVLLDPRILLHKGILGLSIGRSLGALFGALDAAGLHGLFPWLRQELGPGVAKRPWSDVAAQFHSEVATDSGGWGTFRRQFASIGELYDQDMSTTGTHE